MSASSTDPPERPDIEVLLALAARPEDPLPAEVVVYGAGNKGSEVCAALLRQGVRIGAVLDANAKPGQQCAGQAVHIPDDWLTLNPDTRTAVVIAIHNERIALPPIIDAMRAVGFARVITPIALQDVVPGMPFHYWLAPRRHYLAYGAELMRLAEMFHDASSLHWLNAALNLRLSGDYNAYSSPSRDDQYHPRDLTLWPSHLRIIDCGAYTGDTLVALQAAGYHLDSVAAFEPDLGNFNALVNATRAYPDVVLFPCGVGESTGLMGFSSGMGGASHIDPNAEDRIMCVALDDVLPSFHPNLIKMDVEGSEPEALFGARTLIANHRPILAISVYHHPDHLWRIPFLIDAWQLGYRFFLRGHAESSFDLVLYALPPELFNHGNS